jgi:hypothetical protein
MGLTGRNYGFLACFHRERIFFSKTKGKSLWFLSRNSVWLETIGSFIAQLNSYGYMQLELAQYPLWMKMARSASWQISQKVCHFNCFKFMFVVVILDPCDFVLFCSDITALAKDKVYTHVRLDERTIHHLFLVVLHAVSNRFRSCGAVFLGLCQVGLSGL